MGDYVGVATHRSMNFDRVRNAVYRRAIIDAVTADSIVVDLGAGLGMLGFIAAQAGARKVYMVEPEAVIEVTRKIAVVNGLSNVECIRATAETVKLPEKAQLIISVFTGNFLLTEDLLPSLFHARDRLLAPGGKLLPDRARMMVAPVSMPKYYQEYVGNWSLEQALSHGVESHGVDYQSARSYAVNTLYYDTASNFGARLMAAPAALQELDFMTAVTAECDSRVEVRVSEKGLCHGWLGWFDMRLGSEWLSTSPASDSTHWRQVFMPIETPVEVEVGEQLGFDLKRREHSEWTWTTSFNDLLQRQSTFLSEPLTPEILQKKSETFRPNLNELGQAAQYVLSHFVGSESTGALAGALQQHFKSCFSSRTDALRFIKSLVNKYAK